MKPGTKLAHYEIRSKIGAGGMGEVYLAVDTELDRTVAIKILPAALAADAQRLQRFVQEAKAASALNHPHILTIYEIGVTGNSRFIATEFIDGDTLRPHIGAGLKLAEVLEIAIQACAALAAAHAAGIIHRDIKPENIMVRRDGYIKLLDFGLAKLTEPKGSTTDTEAPTKAMVNTGAGTVMGTANYMSPEQAKGTHIDERSDLWSLGAVLYEMVTGHVPFAGETPTETISLILQKEPAPLVRYAHEVPDELERIATKALTKNREERYQTAKDMLIDLRHLKRKLEVDAEIDRTVPPELRAAVSTGGVPGGAATASGAVAATSVASTPHASSAEYIVSEIRRHRKGALLIGALLIAALAVGGFFYFSGKKAALTEKDTVLLADFVNTTGEPVFDGTLKQALAVQLGQSPFLNIFPDERVNETLRFMGKAPNERITKDVAKEICVRQGIKAMIVGSIAGLGSHYVVTIEAINAQAGDAIAREQAEAENKEQVLKALGKATSQLREKLGESLSSIKKFDAPIEQATTSSLEALKAFSQGNEQRIAGNQTESIPFYKRAVELDPNFALAYARLAVAYSNQFQTELAAQYSQKAYDLRDRVSERERFYISEKYTSYVTGDREEAVKVLKAWAQSYPNDYIPHNNLAVNYSLFGQYEDALKESREAVRLSPNNTTAQGNYVENFIKLNRFDEARQVLEQTLGQNPERSIYRFYSSQLAFIRGDQDILKRELDWWSKRPTETDALDYQAGTSAFYGQWQKSRDFSRRSIEMMLSQDRKENAGQAETSNSFFEAVLGRCQQSKEAVARGVALSRDRIGLGSAAMALAYCNELGQAQSFVDELQKRFPKDTATIAVLIPLVRATMEMNRGNTAGAIEILRPATRFEFGNVAGIWLTYVRGQIYLRQKAGNEAAAEFQKILDHRGIEPSSPLYPLAHLGLARASVLSGDTAKARKEYQDFLAVWKDADADLPVVQQAKDEYAKLK
ncbi:MAG TPA: protein kinase [Pyrinomonadaceae bacterium]|nr:protein kinase [Pyrinomonadaceae bacterium]